MGIEGRGEISKRLDPQSDFRARLDKQVARQNFDWDLYNRAIRTFTEIDIPDEAKGVITHLMEARGNLAKSTADTDWMHAIYKVNNKWNDLDGVKGIDICNIKDNLGAEKKVPIETLPENTKLLLPSDVIDDAAMQLSEEVLKPGTPIEEFNARTRQIFFVKDHARERFDKANKTYEETLPSGENREAVDEGVDAVREHAIQHHNLRLINALLDHPRLSVQDMVEIFDKTNNYD